MDGIKNINKLEIDKRKDRITRAWNYQQVDHLPLAFFLEDHRGYTLKELCQDGELQYNVNIQNIDKLLRLLPDDYIPAARIWPGYMTIATMFGLEVHWSDDPDQAPGVKRYLLDSLDDVRKIKKPDPLKDGLMPFNLNWLKYAYRNLPAEVSLTGIDLGGPLNVLKDLLETNLFYLSFNDAPEEMHFLLNMICELMVDCYAEIINAVNGDLNRLTCIDFDPVWAPIGKKGFLADDVCAAVSPQIFKEFSMPYNNRIYEKWGGGLIHNCGPHPSLELYLEHSPNIKGINCAYRYTKDEIPRIKKVFKGRGIAEFMFDSGERGEELIDGYRNIAETLAPDVIGIPVVWITEDWADDEILETYQALLKVSIEYSKAMNWN